MRQFARFSSWYVGAVAWLTPTLLWAADGAARDKAVDTGVSGVWILCNISYAGMRAQNHPSQAWRIVAFIFGVPGTIVTHFTVQEGGYRAYGVHLAKPPSATDKLSRIFKS